MAEPRGAYERPPRGADPIAWLRQFEPEFRARKVGLMGDDEARAADSAWACWAHDGQRPPSGDWRVWVVMAGRGFGKTMAGSQWVADAVRRTPGLRVALVAATLEEGRQVMVEGRSGLLSVAAHEVEGWNPTRGILLFKNGGSATLFAGCSPEKLRGPEHHIAWCDELAKWPRPRETWDNLQLGLRLGTRPRALVTTTPRAGPVLRAIIAEPGCVLTGGRTGANPHLPRTFAETMERLYGGTRLGAQELDGVLLPDGGALWTPEVLEASRVEFPSRLGLPSKYCFDGVLWEGSGVGLPYSDAAAAVTGPPPTPPACGRGDFSRTLIGVDPPSGDGTCGIVACAVDGEGVGHVLADHSVTARSPEGWARAVADAAQIHGTREVVAERNQGGRMVEAVLRAADADLDVRLVHASDGKAVRAEPVALLFGAGRVRLHGRFPELEAELLGLAAGATYQGPGSSPDRADAMVWSLTELMLGRRGEPAVRMM